MQIRMYEHKAVMDAGRERAFSPGVVYDLSPVLADQWVRRGVARAVEDDAQVTPAPQPRAKAGKAAA